MIQPGYRDARPIYEQIKDGIRKMIITNAMTENEKLPSVRELALKLAVNPAAVEHAYCELEKDGYICRKMLTGEYFVQNVNACKRQELLERFGGVVTELLGMSAEAGELVMRVQALAEGEKKFD